MEDGDSDGDNHSDRHSNKFGNGIMYEVETLPGVNKEGEPDGFALFIY